MTYLTDFLIVVLQCSGYHYWTSSHNKVLIQVPYRSKSCSECVKGFWWWEPLTVVLAGNKVNYVLLVKNSAKTKKNTHQIKSATQKPWKLAQKY